MNPVPWDRYRLNVDRDIEKRVFDLALVTGVLGLSNSEASKNGYYIARERRVKLFCSSHDGESHSPTIRVLCHKSIAQTISQMNSDLTGLLSNLYAERHATAAVDGQGPGANFAGRIASQLGVD